MSQFFDSILDSLSHDLQKFVNRALVLLSSRIVSSRGAKARPRPRGLVGTRRGRHCWLPAGADWSARLARQARLPDNRLGEESGSGSTGGTYVRVCPKPDWPLIQPSLSSKRRGATAGGGDGPGRGRMVQVDDHRVSHLVFDQIAINPAVGVHKMEYVQVKK